MLTALIYRVMKQDEVHEGLAGRQIGFPTRDRDDECEIRISIEGVFDLIDRPTGLLQGCLHILTRRPFP